MKRSNPKAAGLIMLLFIFTSAGRMFSQHEVKVYKIDQLLKRISSEDTIYVVNFWATWCKPCVAELPEFEKLNADSAGRKIKVLLVSMDFKEDIKTKLQPFLEKRQVKCETVLLDENDATTFIPKLDEKWSGAIPATLFKRGNKKLLAEKKLKIEELQELLKKNF